MAQEPVPSYDLIVNALHSLGLVQDRDSVKPESLLKEQFGMDSLDVVEVVMTLEELIDDDIDEKAFEPMITVTDMVRELDKARGL